jgi:hypothetical protein
MLRRARGRPREVRPRSRLTSAGRIPVEHRASRPACKGRRGAVPDGSTAGLLTRKAHPQVDSRPSEDQAAFAGRGRSVEGLALWLPSLSDPARVARPPPSASLVRASGQSRSVTFSHDARTEPAIASVRQAVGAECRLVETQHACGSGGARRWRKPRWRSPDYRCRENAL